MSESAARGSVRAVTGFVLGSVPTVIVLSLVAAIGWWGHTTGWTVPKFSEVRGETKPEDDWCSEHNVPESICIECDDSLLPKGKPVGFCTLHGIPECTRCNPKLAELAVPPTVTAAELDRAKKALDFAPRSWNNPNCRTHLRRIQFATERDANKAGIDVKLVQLGTAVEYVSAPGEIVYDQARIAHLSARSAGSVWKVFRHLGEDVTAGEVLALIDASDVGKAKAEVLQAFGALQLKQQNLAGIRDSGSVVSAAKLREAEAAVKEAEIRVTAGCQSLTNLGLPIDDVEVRTVTAEQLKAKLHLLGIPPSLLKSLGSVATTNLLPLVAPMSGRIVSGDVVAGEVVDSARVLFEVVDTRSLWLTFDLKGEDAHRVRVGQPVKFKPDNGREEVTGTIAWRSTQLDPKTRTVKVRADLADPEGKLLANTFGAGRVILREEKDVVSVPSDAVQWDGCCNVVFVRDKDYRTSEYKVFHVRKVRVGAKDGDKTEIIAGLMPGELLVTKGSGLLLTELLRGSLGAGCACHSKK